MNDTPRDLSGYYFWFDTEYTSLTLDRAQLLQVAMVITDAKMQRVAPADRDFNALIRLGPEDRCDPWVQEHLAGLIQRCRSDEARPIADVHTALTQYIADVLGPNPASIKQRPPLAGNSLQGDWFLARKFLPGLIERAHYRVLDVSSWKVFWKNELGDFPFDKDNEPLVRQYFPGEFNSSAEAHDAHFDVLASIAEMNFYRTHQKILWPPQPPAP
ncbi:MAG: hypothetical protein K8T26_04605 [Lentisphaerae bacterium]|nr:hypothetical protein [Lentisphaerota bacterium]